MQRQNKTNKKSTNQTIPTTSVSAVIPVKDWMYFFKPMQCSGCNRRKMYLENRRETDSAQGAAVKQGLADWGLTCVGTEAPGTILLPDPCMAAVSLHIQSILLLRGLNSTYKGTALGLKLSRRMEARSLVLRISRQRQGQGPQGSTGPPHAYSTNVPAPRNSDKQLKGELAQTVGEQV